MAAPAVDTFWLPGFGRFVGTSGTFVPLPSLPPDTAPAQGAGHTRRSIAHRLGFAFGPRARMRYGWNDGRYACTIRMPVPTDGAAPAPGGHAP